MVTCFERAGALVWGALGTNPLAIAQYFRHLGYSVTISADPSKFDAQAKKNTANVLFYFHGQAAHNIALRWNGSTFVGYNIYSDSKGPYSIGRSIQNFLSNGKLYLPILISISKRR